MTLTISPLLVPNRKPAPTVVLAYRTTTGDRPRPAPRPTCPGCSGEASKSVGVMLGCPICPL